MNVAELNFESLDTISIPVKIGDRTFTLREASSENYCKYQDARIGAAVYDDKGVRTGYKDLSDIEPLLVSMCLIETTNGQASGVSLQEIRSWPAKVVNKLYDAAARLSEIIVEESEEDLLKQRDEIDEKLKALKKGSAAKNDQNS